MKKYIYSLMIVGLLVTGIQVANATIRYNKATSPVNSEISNLEVKASWVYESYFTIEDLMTALNALPVDKQLEAKIIVINSQRSFVGIWSDPYYLIHR